MRFLAAIFTAIALTGCASSDYRLYAETQVSIAKANAAAEAVKYQSLARIAETGDATARVVAALSLGGFGAQQHAHQPPLAAPKSFAEQALQWTGLLLPSVTQVYAVNRQTSLGMRQSDNATALGISTNQAFVGIASRIQAPAPNVTLNGNGVIGSGTYAIGPNSGANSGNTGKIAGTVLTDQTSVPTVVRPEVVTNTNTTTTTNNTTSTTTTTSQAPASSDQCSGGGFVTGGAC